MEYNSFLKQFKALIEQTTRYVPPQRGDYQDNYDRYVDFPYVDDPKGFVTHRPLESDEPLGYDDKIGEQSGGGHTPGTAPQPRKDIATEQDAAPTADPTPKTGNPAMPDPVEAGGDAGAMDMGGDMGAAGMDPMGGGMGMGEQQEEELTSSQIGRMYELKKIYSRLSSVETYLSRATDESILELRKFVAQSIDLFEVVVSNYPQYKENVDEIIVQFYEFLDKIYESLRKYYKTMKDINTGS